MSRDLLRWVLRVVVASTGAAIVAVGTGALTKAIVTTVRGSKRALATGAPWAETALASFADRFLDSATGDSLGFAAIVLCVMLLPRKLWGDIASGVLGMAIMVAWGVVLAFTWPEEAQRVAVDAWANFPLRWNFMPMMVGLGASTAARATWRLLWLTFKL